MDRTDVTDRVRQLVRRWEREHHAMLNSVLDKVALGPHRWLRYGCHFFSRGVGRWVREVLPETDSAGNPTLPFETSFCMIRRNWLQVYEVSPRRVNWLSSQAFRRPLLLIIGGRREANAVRQLADQVRTVADPHTPAIGFLNKKVATCIASNFTDFELDLLDRHTLLNKDRVGTKNPYWSDVIELAENLADQLMLDEWADTRTDISPHARARSFGYTLLPPLIDLYSRHPRKGVLIYLVVPWATPHPAGSGFIDHGNFALVTATNKLQLARLTVESVTSLCNAVTVTSRESVLLELLALESQANVRSPIVFVPEVEMAVRELSSITWSSLERIDVFSSEREALADLRSTPSDPIDPRSVSLWGASSEYRGYVNFLLSFADSWYNRYESTPRIDLDARDNRQGKVDTLFMLSPPGCGKETLWELLCAKAVTFRELKVNRHGAAAHKHAQLAKYLDAYQDRRPPLPESAIMGRELGGAPEALNIMFGEDGVAGRLARFTLLRHPFFIDEFNTISPAAADLLLRVLAAPYEILDRGFQRPVVLDLPIIFASNVDRNLLRDELRINDAVLTRIMSPDGYVHIQPLSHRRADTIVSLAWGLLRGFEKKASSSEQIEEVSIDPSALRLLASVNWDAGNYRELGKFCQSMVEGEWAMRQIVAPGAKRIRIRLEINEVIQYLHTAGKLK